MIKGIIAVLTAAQRSLTRVIAMILIGKERISLTTELFLMR